MSLDLFDSPRSLRPCTNVEARELTDRIKAAVEQVWALLLEAHERRAWAALGYQTWEEYVRGEFHMSRRRSYEILDQGRVIRAIEGATGVRNSAQEVTPYAAEEVKPVLPEVVDSVRERVAELPEPESERVQAIVREEVEKARTAVRERQQERREDAEFVRRYQPPGFNAEENAELVRQRGAFARLTTDLVALGDPIEFLDRHRDSLRDEHIDSAAAAMDWLHEFLDTWRNE